MEADFEKGSPLPTTGMLRQFIYYVADCSQGHSENKRTQLTAIDYTISFFGAMAY